MPCPEPSACAIEDFPAQCPHWPHRTPKALNPEPCSPLSLHRCMWLGSTTQFCRLLVPTFTHSFAFLIPFLRSFLHSFVHLPAPSAVHPFTHSSHSLRCSPACMLLPIHSPSWCSAVAREAEASGERLLSTHTAETREGNGAPQGGVKTGRHNPSHPYPAHEEGPHSLKVAVQERAVQRVHCTVQGPRCTV